MTQRTLSAPIRNNLRSWHRASALMLLLLPSACGQTRDSTDTRTNWLSSCSEDMACGSGLSCVCGVCTQPCESGQSCGEVNEDAVCVEVPGCEEASQVCAKEGFFDAPTDGSVVDPEDGNATQSPNSESASGETSAVVTTTTSMPSSDAAETTRDSDAVLDGSTSAGESTTDGSSGTLVDGGVCNDPDREYVSRDPAECDTLPECGIIAEGVGKIAFSDECGCGCEPFVLPPQTDSITAGQCAESAPSGTPANFEVLAESSTGQWLCDNIPTALLRSYADMAQWAGESGCGDLASLMADVDFETQSVIVVGTPERPSASVSYTVQTIDGTIHVGVEADAYCGGARPSSGFVLVTVNAGPGTALRVVTETCLAECPDDGGLPVP
jgi:hypothetical protein